MVRSWQVIRWAVVEVVVMERLGMGAGVVCAQYQSEFRSLSGRKISGSQAQHKEERKRDLPLIGYSRVGV